MIDGQAVMIDYADVDDFVRRGLPDLRLDGWEPWFSEAWRLRRSSGPCGMVDVFDARVSPPAARRANAASIASTLFTSSRQAD